METDQSKKKWINQEITTIILWIVLIALWIGLNFYWPFLILLLVHFSENLISHKKVKDQGYSFLEIFFYTLIFGYTWWVPVSKGIFKKN